MASADAPVCRSMFSPFPPVEPLSAEEVARIHEASLSVLEDIGMDVLSEQARAILGEAGADVDAQERVRFPRELVEAAVARAPKSFRLFSHDESWYLEFGGNAINFGTVASVPYCSDLKQGRRSGTIADFRALVRLADMLPEVRLYCGYVVEPQDLPAETRHLDAIQAFLTLSNKPCHAYSLGVTRILDGLEMVKLVRDIDDAALSARPSLITIINTSSPLRFDGPMADGMLEMARAGQPVVVTPFTLSGAMSPITLAGALVQQNAEALAVIALIQLAAPGAPTIYGGFTSNVDMRSGSPAFGTPEYARAVLAGAQLARRYGLPFRASNVNASNAIDAQAAYESMTSLWAVMLGHTNLIMHGAGWLEGGLTGSYEKMVIDAELYDRLERTFTLPEDSDWHVDPDDVEAMTDTLRNGVSISEQAPVPPDLADAGCEGEDMVAHAAETVARRIAAHEPPELAPERREALEAFVARRKEEGGARAD